MPSFTYIGGEPRYYPDLGVHAEPGSTATLDQKPDELWVTSKSQKAAAVAADTTEA